MSYVLERDGIAACPDDPARTADLDERVRHLIDLAEATDDYKWRVKAAIQSVLAGQAPGTIVYFAGRLQFFNRADIGEILGGEVSDDEFGMLLGALRSPDARAEADAIYERLIDGLADGTSAELAKREVI